MAVNRHFLRIHNRAGMLLARIASVLQRVDPFREDFVSVKLSRAAHFVHFFTSDAYLWWCRPEKRRFTEATWFHSLLRSRVRCLITKENCRRVRFSDLNYKLCCSKEQRRCNSRLSISNGLKLYYKFKSCYYQFTFCNFTDLLTGHIKRATALFNRVVMVAKSKLALCSKFF